VIFEKKKIIKIYSFKEIKNIKLLKTINLNSEILNISFYQNNLFIIQTEIPFIKTYAYENNDLVEFKNNFNNNIENFGLNENILYFSKQMKKSEYSNYKKKSYKIKGINKNTENNENNIDNNENETNIDNNNEIKNNDEPFNKKIKKN
jgi:hypothetical protein